MNNYNINYPTQGTQELSTTKTFISAVFAWMSLALVLTAAVAYWFGTNVEMISYLINLETGKMNVLGWVVMLAPLGFVLTMSFAFQRFSFALLALFFMLYSLFTGMSLSFIFLVYSQASIATTFIASAGMFGLMALVGYTTKTDLTSFGRIMTMGLIGIVIASLINMFVGSSTMDYIISSIGVLVFTGLTAYDVQKIKRVGAGVEYGTQMAAKLSIMGALTLYLDFINLFLMLLRLFGDRRD